LLLDAHKQLQLDADKVKQAKANNGGLIDFNEALENTMGLD
jgi:hypothetical protein